MDNNMGYLAVVLSYLCKIYILQ